MTTPHELFCELEPKLDVAPTIRKLHSTGRQHVSHFEHSPMPLSRCVSSTPGVVEAYPPDATVLVNGRSTHGSVVEKRAALAIIEGHPWSAIVLTFDGRIAEVVPFSAEPSAQTFLEFSRAHARGRRFRFLRQATLTEPQLDALVAEIMGKGEPPRPQKSDTLGQRVASWQSSLHPFSGARAIADAIADFVARRSR